MALTAGNWNLTTTVKISSASVAAQGNAVTNTLAVPSYGPSSSDQQALAFGTDPGEADILIASQNTLAATTDVTYDLFTGADLKDVYGETAPVRTLRSICIVIDDGGDALGLRIGDAAADGTPLFFGADDQTWTIFPSGPPFVGGSEDGVVVDANTKNLRLENLGAGDVTFTVYIAASSV